MLSLADRANQLCHKNVQETRLKRKQLISECLYNHSFRVMSGTKHHMRCRYADA